jgi:hypothetical protein
MSDQPSATPSAGGQGGAPAAPPPASQTKSESRQSPVSQGKPGFSKRIPDWMAWARQLPTFLPIRPDPNFQLLKEDKLNALLQNARPDVAQRIRDDIQFMEHDLLRLFRERDLEAKIQQNRYRQYQIAYILLAAIATIIGSIQALALKDRPQAVLLLSLCETAVALFSTFLAQLSSHEPPMPLWLSNRRRAESLRREYFRYLMNLPPYNDLEGYKRKLTLADRAASIYAGKFPADEAQG